MFSCWPQFNTYITVGHFVHANQGLGTAVIQASLIRIQAPDILPNLSHPHLLTINTTTTPNHPSQLLTPTISQFSASFGIGLRRWGGLS